MRISVSRHIKSPFVRQLVYGLSSLLVAPAKGTGGTSSAEYCYSVYLRHMVVAHTNGISTRSKVIAEIGPGDSLGIGLAAMLTGVEQYFAFDVIDHANTQNNLVVFDRLVELFQKRSPIPSGGIFEGILPSLETYEFPSNILSEGRLEETLHPDRIARIRSILVNDSFYRPDSPVRYFAPWGKLSGAKLDSVDIIISQAVMEHVDDLAEAYNACFHWLRPGGFMSHQIDFSCHDTAREWNGHWKYSAPVWKTIRGVRPWLLNRHCYSMHIEMISRVGFEIVHTSSVKRKDGVQRPQLADKFRDISDDDLITSSALIQARKPKIFK